MTGVIVRSSAECQAGRRTRRLAIMHGLWLLIFASMIPLTLRYVPVSTLAAVLSILVTSSAYPKIVLILLKYG